jgi:NifU-like protein involved in Fe-S cluster formation
MGIAEEAEKKILDEYLARRHVGSRENNDAAIGMKP